MSLCEPLTCGLWVGACRLLMLMGAQQPSLVCAGPTSPLADCRWLFPLKGTKTSPQAAVSPCIPKPRAII